MVWNSTAHRLNVLKISIIMMRGVFCRRKDISARKRQRGLPASMHLFSVYYFYFKFTPAPFPRVHLAKTPLQLAVLSYSCTFAPQYGQRSHLRSSGGIRIFFIFTSFKDSTYFIIGHFIWQSNELLYSRYLSTTLAVLYLTEIGTAVCNALLTQRAIRKSCK